MKASESNLNENELRSWIKKADKPSIGITGNFQLTRSIKGKQKAAKRGTKVIRVKLEKKCFQCNERKKYKRAFIRNINHFQRKRGLNYAKCRAKYMIFKAVEQIVSKNQVSPMDWKSRKNLQYALQTILSKTRSISCKTQRERSTKGTRLEFDWDWGQCNGCELHRKLLLQTLQLATLQILKLALQTIIAIMRSVQGTECAKRAYIDIIDHFWQKRGQYYAWNTKTGTEGIRGKFEWEWGESIGMKGHTNFQHALQTIFSKYKVKIMQNTDQKGGTKSNTAKFQWEWSHFKQ